MTIVMRILTRRLMWKIEKTFSTSLHLWFCIRIPTSIVIPNLVQNIGNPAIVLVVQRTTW